MVLINSVLISVLIKEDIFKLFLGSQTEGGLCKKGCSKCLGCGHKGLELKVHILFINFYHFYFNIRSETTFK